MVSSRKPKEEKKPRSDGVVKTGGRSKRTSGSKSKNQSNKVNSGSIVKKEPEVYEISDSSSSEEEEEARANELNNGKSSVIPAKRRRQKEEDDDDGSDDVVGGGRSVEEDVKKFKFPMNRIRRIMRLDDSSAPQIMQDAVFLVNKATEMFIERFSEEAYESSVQDKKKFIHYKHLSSVVSNEERYKFLADCVPEKLKAEVALEEWERAMANAG